MYSSSSPSYQLVNFMWGSGSTFVNVTPAATSLLNTSTGLITGPSHINLGDPTPGVVKTASISYNKLGVLQPPYAWTEGSSTNIQLP